MIERARTWLRAHEPTVIVALVTLAAVLRAVLVVNAPPFGYVWDFYQDGIRVLSVEGRLPVAADCWQCYHPPLFYVAGVPFFALGSAIARGADDPIVWRVVAGMALPAAAVTIWYGWRLLRMFGCRGASLILGTAILLMCPALFISSYGAEADIVLTAILSAFLFHLTRWWIRPSSTRMSEVVLIGMLAGLAAATKYSGLVALATAGLLTMIRLASGPERARAARDGMIVLSLCLLVGGWKYVDNVRKFGTAMHANGSATEGLSLGMRANRGHYEFGTIRLRELRALYGTSAPAGELTQFPVYTSVITSLHAQVWSDMSFFSVRSRHGAPGAPYPRKRIPVDLTMAVVVLGFVPEALALVGVLVTIRRRAFTPFAVFGLVTLGAYVYWFLPQELWAIKAKYILCLLPPAVVYAMVGQGWVSRRVPWAGAATALATAVLLVLTAVYLYAFAAGRLL